MDMQTRDSKIDTKTRSFVESLFLTVGFQQRVIHARKMLSLPPSGLNIRIYDKLVIQERVPRLPSSIKRRVWLNEICKILEIYNLGCEWIECISDYVLFNWTPEYEDTENIRQIVLLDLGTKNSENDTARQNLLATFSHNLNPIAILLPTSTSQREIEHFIERNMRLIREMQRRYGGGRFRKITFARGKSRKVQARNSMIYSKRGLNKAVIAQLIFEHFGEHLDRTYINAIIKAEMKKRGGST